MKVEKAKEGVVSFRYLTKEEMKNPLLVIEDFFQCTYLELFRQELRLWFALASTKADYMKRRNYYPSELTTLHQQVIKFLEGAYLLLKNKNISFKMEETHSLYQANKEWDGFNSIDVESRLDDGIMKYCRLLNDKEINNVKKVFRSIFKYMDLAQWREELDSLLYYSLSEVPSAEDCNNSYHLFPMYELLEKLLETVYVVHKFVEVEKSLQFRLQLISCQPFKNAY